MFNPSLPIRPRLNRPNADYLLKLGMKKELFRLNTG
jgi:hypothetical protein